MGATILTGKAACSFATSAGEPVFVCFERTHEKNCYPHSPRWGCIAIGDAEHVWKRLILNASVCEGGMLRSQTGDILPEAYLQDWRKELSQSRQLGVSTARVNPDLLRYYGAEERERTIDGLAQRLQPFGMRGTEILASLRPGSEAIVSLFDEWPLVRAILGDGEEGIPPWRLVNDVHLCASTEKSQLLFPATLQDVKAPEIRAFRLVKKTNGTLGNEVVVSIDGAPLRNMGWDYSAVSRFVKDHAGPADFAKAGTAGTWLPAFRQALRDAPALPADTQIVISPCPADAPSYRRERRDELRSKLPAAEVSVWVDGSFEFTLATVEGADALQELISVYEADAFYIVPSAEPVALAA